MAFGITPTRSTWDATKKAFSWTAGKLKKGIDFIDRQWRTNIRPAVTKTIGQSMMDSLAHKAGSTVENSLGGVGTTLDIASKTLELLPQKYGIGKLKNWSRKGSDYLATAGDNIRNYVSPGSVDRFKTKADQKEAQQSAKRKETVNTLKDIFDGKDVPEKKNGFTLDDNGKVRDPPSSKKWKDVDVNFFDKNLSPHTRVTKAKSGRMRLSQTNRPSGFLGSIYDLANGWLSGDPKFGTPSVYGSNRG